MDVDLKMEPYAPRSFRFIELVSIGAWRMKLYGIAREKEFPRPEVLSAAKELTQTQLKTERENNYGVGFICAHDGRNACFVFVDFWGNENELFHRVFLPRAGNPEELVPAKATDSSVCVWDLHLQSFERAAWIKNVLMRTDAPDLEGYLAERMNEDA